MISFKTFDEKHEGLFTYLTFHSDDAYYINQQLYANEYLNQDISKINKGSGTFSRAT